MSVPYCGSSSLVRCPDILLSSALLCSGRHGARVAQSERRASLSYSVKESKPGERSPCRLGAHFGLARCFWSAPSVCAPCAGATSRRSAVECERGVECWWPCCVACSPLRSSPAGWYHNRRTSHRRVVNTRACPAVGSIRTYACGHTRLPSRFAWERAYQQNAL